LRRLGRVIGAGRASICGRGGLSEPRVYRTGLPPPGVL